jgi:hypothetical protein
MPDDTIVPPRGKFAGYDRNGLAALAQDEEITRIMPGTPAGTRLDRILHRTGVEKKRSVLFEERTKNFCPFWNVRQALPRQTSNP